MKTELLRASTGLLPESSGFGQRDTFLADAYTPSILDKMEADLKAEGSLFGDWPTKRQVSIMTDKLGSFAADRMIGFTPELTDVRLQDQVFVGGVCALSTRESTLLGIGKVEDSISGNDIAIQDSDSLSGAVTAVQIFETIGLMPSASAIVLEDTLWGDRVAQKMSDVGSADETMIESARAAVEARNQRSYECLQRLRKFVLGEAVELEVVRDGDVMDELTVRTDEMLTRLGLPITDNSYRFVYAGMYSYVWRQIMSGQGIVSDDQVMTIYEPWKHFAPEDGLSDPISVFRGAVLKQEPFMAEGSENERVGIIAYAEPRDPNGRILRKSLPMALLPNSANYRDFDFSKFPVVPKKTNALPEAKEFKYVTDMASLTLDRNPAFLWGLVYPPTSRTRYVMAEMVRLKRQLKLDTRIAYLRDPCMSALNRKDLSIKLRTNLSREMTDLSEQLVSELETITKAMFGGTDEIK